MDMETRECRARGRMCARTTRLLTTFAVGLLLVGAAARCSAQAHEEAPRRGWVLDLSLGGGYTYNIEQGTYKDGSRFGGSLGILFGHHTGEDLAVLADIHLVAWPEMSSYRSAGLVGAGPALRLFPGGRMSFEGGLSWETAMPNWDWENPWFGPAGHLAVGYEISKGGGRFALELRARFDLAYLTTIVGSGAAHPVTLGRAESQLVLALR
jgi:hypothetical protein